MLKLLFFYLVSLVGGHLVGDHSVQGQNMNGDIYGISNPDLSSKPFNAIYTSSYFDVYSPIIESRYGEVYWTMMKSVPLPKQIVDKFNNNTMAIVGYEMNQVFKGNGESEDISVPITWAYNHHYETYLLGNNTYLEKNNNTNYTNDWGIYNHGSKSLWNLNPIFDTPFEIPHSQFFSEANGGESRGSYHGYPNNMAQLINSPKMFQIQPMQIDTRNRDPKYIDDEIFHPGILPKESASPPNASYSGLLECPCTDRVIKSIKYDYNLEINVTNCNKNINNRTQCFDISKKFITSLKNITVNDRSLPTGCSFNYEKNIVVFNRYTKSNYNPTNDNYDLFLGKSSTQTAEYHAEYHLTIDFKKNNLTFNVSGPADVWFGLALNAKSMSDLPYSIIFDGTGQVLEYKLGKHSSGNKLNKTINIISNKVINNMRYVLLSRLNSGYSPDYYKFNKDTLNIPILNAQGSKKEFSYHKSKSADLLSIFPENFPENSPEK